MPQHARPPPLSTSLTLPPSTLAHSASTTLSHSAPPPRHALHAPPFSLHAPPFSLHAPPFSLHAPPFFDPLFVQHSAPLIPPPTPLHSTPCPNPRQPQNGSCHARTSSSTPPSSSLGKRLGTSPDERFGDNLGLVKQKDRRLVGAAGLAVQALEVFAELVLRHELRICSVGGGLDGASASHISKNQPGADTPPFCGGWGGQTAGRAVWRQADSKQKERAPLFPPPTTALAQPSAALLHPLLSLSVPLSRTRTRTPPTPLGAHQPHLSPATYAASRERLLRPEPPTPTSNALPRGCMRMRWMRQMWCSASRNSTRSIALLPGSSA
eukprot:363771-Chlamydomonas_euryale.AAC.21